MKTRNIILVLGGCRSGKSRHALELGEGYLGKRNLFIATCVPADKEMMQRVARHQSERGEAWSTLEIPIHLAEIIKTESTRADVIIVDCLTLWMSNLIVETGGEQDEIDTFVGHLTNALTEAQCPVILVSNEVGAGIVPDNALARRYRDAAGWMNQAVAGIADRVIHTVAGIAVVIKKDR